MKLIISVILFALCFVIHDSMAHPAIEKYQGYELTLHSQQQNELFPGVSKAIEDCIKLDFDLVVKNNIFSRLKSVDRFSCKGYRHKFNELVLALFACVEKNEQGGYSCRKELPSDFNDFNFHQGNYTDMMFFKR
ncbi:uncharacterized protein LOC122498517 [Leptopilina heterotoma]|uniref:uncharacterized protein LOC122498517 n=1 Tax=Leptopilina heterotoma TaxID=63436 RepID=UPI001CA89992|nr:uncharacterized protein LOC122498517 [Leptopilina heterotoma]